MNYNSKQYGFLREFTNLKWYLLNVLGKEWYHQTLFVNCLGKEASPR